MRPCAPNGSFSRNQTVRSNLKPDGRSVCCRTMLAFNTPMHGCARNSKTLMSEGGVGSVTALTSGGKLRRAKCCGREPPGGQLFPGWGHSAVRLAAFRALSPRQPLLKRRARCRLLRGSVTAHGHKTRTRQFQPYSQLINQSTLKIALRKFSGPRGHEMLQMGRHYDGRGQGVGNYLMRLAIRTVIRPF